MHNSKISKLNPLTDANTTITKVGIESYAVFLLSIAYEEEEPEDGFFELVEFDSI
jgi:hypothetical protein